jgi:hypothetical protein
MLTPYRKFLGLRFKDKNNGIDEYFPSRKHVRSGILQKETMLVSLVSLGSLLSLSTMKNVIMTTNLTLFLTLSYTRGQLIERELKL